MIKIVNTLELHIKKLAVGILILALGIVILPNPTAAARPDKSKSLAKKQKSADSNAERKIADTSNMHTKVSPGVTALPFGVGYFAKDHNVLGSLSFALQAASLGGYFYFNDLAESKIAESQSQRETLERNSRNYSDDDLDNYSEAANSYIDEQSQMAQTSLLVFVGTWGLSALHSTFGFSNSIHIGATMPQDFDLPALTLTVSH